MLLGIAIILNNMPPILKSNFLCEYRYRKLLQICLNLQAVLTLASCEM